MRRGPAFPMDVRHGVAPRVIVAAALSAQRVHGATGLLTWVIAADSVARASYEGRGAELPRRPPH